jgi:glycosyltransferase involved in cell wall biosynthesis
VEGAKALSLRGHECHVVLPRDGPLAERLREWAGVQVIAHNPWLATQRSPVVSARWAQYNLRRAAPDIARFARRIAADVVLTNTMTVPSGAVAARLARLPHVWFIHEFGWEDHGLRYLIGLRPTLLLMRALTDLFLVSSDALRTFHAPRLEGRPVHVVRYAVEVPNIPVSSAGSTGFRAILLGAKLPGKGHIDAIAAVAELARTGVDAQLDLVGGGSEEYEAELRRKVRREGLDDRVRFLGFREDALSLLASSDVALMCSRSEAFGRVTIEAMKLGRPVVGSASGATPDLIRHGWNGYLYRPGDAGDLAHWLRALYENRGTAMGRNGREWARTQFTVEGYGAGLERELSDVLTSARVSASHRARAGI